MKQLGERWRDSCWDGVSGDKRAPAEPLTNTHACALAAAMPAWRESALDGALRRLDPRGRRQRAAAPAVEFGIAELDDGCDGALRRMSERGRFDEAAATAERCGDRRAQNQALVALGRFEDAALVSVPDKDDYPSLPSGPALILAGRWDAAAAAATAKANDIAHADHKPDEHVTVEMEVQHYRCLSELLHAHAGDPQAIDRLRALVSTPLGDECVPMLAEVAGADERRALRAQAGRRVQRDHDHRRRGGGARRRQAGRATSSIR